MSILNRLLRRRRVLDRPEARAAALLHETADPETVAQREGLREQIARAHGVPLDFVRLPAQPNPERMLFLCPGPRVTHVPDAGDRCLVPLPCHDHKATDPNTGMLLYGSTFARPEARP